MNSITEYDQPTERVIVDRPEPRSVQTVQEEPARQPGCPALSQALSLARDHCKMARKNSRNDFSKYDYASADEVIGTAKEAMAGTGLALIPQLQELVVIGEGNMALYALNRTMLLSHSSGEFVPLSVRGWPVVPIKGSPLDKAFAIALTSSLSYLYRDLLQMERGKEGDIDSRKEEPDQQQPARQPSENYPAKPPAQRQSVDEATLNGLRDELNELINKIAFARDVEPDLVFGKLSAMVKAKYPGAGKSTSEWLKSELDYAISSAKSTLADSPAKAPDRPSEAKPEPQSPTQTGHEIFVAATQKLMLDAGIKWPAIMVDAPRIIGVPLAKGSYVKDLTIQQLEDVQKHCRKIMGQPA